MVSHNILQDPNRQRNLDEEADIEKESIINLTTQPTVIQSTGPHVANKSDEASERKTEKVSTEKKFDSDKVNSRKERQILDTLMSRKRLYKILMDKMEK